MSEIAWLAKVHFPDTGGTLTLRPDWRWEADRADLEVLAEFADTFSQWPHYEYSPADGFPGAALAHQIAKRFRGRVEFPPRPPLNPGADY